MGLPTTPMVSLLSCHTHSQDVQVSGSGSQAGHALLQQRHRTQGQIVRGIQKGGRQLVNRSIALVEGGTSQARRVSLLNASVARRFRSLVLPVSSRFLHLFVSAFSTVQLSVQAMLTLPWPPAGSGPSRSSSRSGRHGPPAHCHRHLDSALC